MQTTAHILKPDTQAILLLCAGFGQKSDRAVPPLSLSEYSYLAQQLQQRHLRPADLLTVEGRKQLSDLAHRTLTSERLTALLERGAMLGLAVENWTNRGLWVLSRGDEAYPRVLKTKLQHLAPPILYGIGEIELLNGGGVAIVGSRDVDEAGLHFTQSVAEKCVQEGIQVVSGGARGVDQVAMLATVEAGGIAIGVLADSLAQAAVSKKYRAGIQSGQLTLISPFDPNARFHVGNAMGRNKYVYALADYALVVSSAFNQGGTWAGATEALKQKLSPVFVRVGESLPEGNQRLVEMGAHPFPEEATNLPFQTSLLQGSYGQSTPVRSTQDVDLISYLNSTEPKIPEHNANLLPTAPKTRTVFEAVLPLILDLLQEPKDKKQIAELLNVRPTQLQDWLDEAISQELIRKTKQGYIINQKSAQLSLLR